MSGQVVALPVDQARSTDELEHEITQLSARIHAATCELLLLIAEYDERSGWINTGMRSCAHWLNWKCGISLGAAREKVRVANSLAGLPEIRTAFARGEVSYSKVRAMTRIATLENENTLMNIARHGTATHVEKLVRYYRRMSEVEAIGYANRQHSNRSLHYFTDDDGSLVIKGQLPAEVGVIFVKAIEAAMDEYFSNTVPGVADAADSHQIPVATAAENVPAGTPDSPIGARRADALALMAESYLASELDTVSSADRYQVVVHMSADGCELEDGPHVPAETCKRLGCDAGIVQLTEDALGNPLHVGRKTRSISPALRRALRSRDRGCRFPGCTARRFVDGHHMQHWAEGGATDIDNLVSLCRHHHRLVHEGGFSVRADPPNQFVFMRPNGIPIAEYERADCGTQNQLPDTVPALTFWNGDSMDYNVTLYALAHRTQQPAGMESHAESGVPP